MAWAGNALQGVHTRETVAAEIAKNVVAIGYSNVKASVEGDTLHDAYLRLWAELRVLQRV